MENHKDMVTNLHSLLNLSGEEAVIKARATSYTRTTYDSFINMGSIILNYIFITSQIKIALLITNGRYLKHPESTGR